ncbi:hypothetical protein [Shewanella gelidii]|uniref:Uncharacterized protein n=1 Tax=Shewanella gelidii TaxID=1642821 RepID=A0A917JQM6_9GAMM|nr:hypothetical protein [Shewanella gelidii]MCL1097787.1 hypothetical protein [Shewanella gelidii]GGI78769.1 hypothetical protein GCM10009332_15210 [Shewanella gelidii]
MEQAANNQLDSVRRGLSKGIVGAVGVGLWGLNSTGLIAGARPEEFLFPVGFIKADSDLCRRFFKDVCNQIDGKSEPGRELTQAAFEKYLQNSVLERCFEPTMQFAIELVKRNLGLNPFYNQPRTDIIAVNTPITYCNSAVNWAFSTKKENDGDEFFINVPNGIQRNAIASIFDAAKFGEAHYNRLVNTLYVPGDLNPDADLALIAEESGDNISEKFGKLYTRSSTQGKVKLLAYVADSIDKTDYKLGDFKNLYMKKEWCKSELDEGEDMRLRGPYDYVGEMDYDKELMEYYHQYSAAIANMLLVKLYHDEHQYSGSVESKKLQVAHQGILARTLTKILGFDVTQSLNLSRINKHKAIAGSYRLPNIYLQDSKV